MLDTVQITINAHNFERLCKLHNKWRKAKGSVMVEQDLNYMIDRLLTEVENGKDI